MSTHIICCSKTFATWCYPRSIFSQQTQPFIVTNEGLKTIINNEVILFNFVDPPKHGLIDEMVNFITYKENHIKNLK